MDEQKNFLRVATAIAVVLEIITVTVGLIVTPTTLPWIRYTLTGILVVGIAVVYLVTVVSGRLHWGRGIPRSVWREILRLKGRWEYEVDTAGGPAGRTYSFVRRGHCTITIVRGEIVFNGTRVSSELTQLASSGASPLSKTNLNLNWSSECVHYSPHDHALFCIFAITIPPSQANAAQNTGHQSGFVKLPLGPATDTHVAGECTMLAPNPMLGQITLTRQV